MCQMDEGKDSLLIIPKSDYIDALAADVGDMWQPGAGKKLLPWARKVHSTLGINDRIYDLPSGLNNAILTGNYKVPQSLQRRMDRHAMATVAEHGHTGEEEWIIVTMDGEECMSSGVHILGVFVGHMGYIAHKRTTKQKTQGLFWRAMWAPRPCCSAFMKAN